MFVASAHMFRATQYCGVVRWDFLTWMLTFVFRYVFLVTYRAARVNALGHGPADFLNLNNDSKWIYE